MPREGGSELAGVAIGAVVSGGNVKTAAMTGNIAQTATTYNRLMHPDETKKLKDLQAGKSPEEQYRLAAAECSLVHCADGIPDSEPQKATLQKMQDDGQQYEAEQEQLRTAGAFDGYGRLDSSADWNMRHQVANRVTGSVQGVLSMSGAAVVGAGGCAGVITCAAALVGTGILVDYSYSGFKQAVYGESTTYGEQALQSLGLSPAWASVTYGGLGIATGAGAAFSPATSARAETSIAQAARAETSIAQAAREEGAAKAGGIANPAGGSIHGPDNIIVGDGDLIRTPPTPSQTAELIAEHSKSNTLPLTSAGADAITEHINPPGTTARVAGDNAKGPDIFVTNSANGNHVMTVQVKAVSNPDAFEGAVREDLRKTLGEGGGSEVIAVQVPVGSSPARLAGKLGNFSSSRAAGRSILVVDTQGRVLIPLQPIKNFERKR